MHFGAPEQFEKRLLQWVTTPTVDIYGFAALSYFVLTGQEPPVFASWQEAHWERLSESISQSAVAAFIKDIDFLIKDCTQYNPEERPQEMEVVVARLTRAMTLLESKADLEEKDWLLEVMHTAGGGTVSDPVEGFTSRAGGVRWRITKTKASHGKISGLDAVCTLNRDPRFEGVNFRGFTKGSVKQVDTRLQQFKSNPSQTVSVVRHGQLVGAGTTMSLNFSGLEPSKVCARLVGELLASVSRIVE
jgi:hypothetical protein